MNPKNQISSPGQPESPGALSTEVTPRDVVSKNPLDLPPVEFKAGLERRGMNRQALLEWIRSKLVKGVDYGQIHFVKKEKCPAGDQCTNKYHWSKPNLWKPGAEKVCGMLGIIVEFPTLKDYEKAAVDGKRIESIVLRCELMDGQGNIVAKGVGCRSVSQERGDLNKAMKMAEKSGHVDATLRLAGLSEIFTQDLEHAQYDETGNVVMPEPPPPPPPPTHQAPHTQAAASQPPASGSARSNMGFGGKGSSTPKMKSAVWTVINIQCSKPDIGIADESALKKFAHWLFNVNSIDEAAFQDVKNFLNNFSFGKNHEQMVGLWNEFNTAAQPAAATNTDAPPSDM